MELAGGFMLEPLRLLWYPLLVPKMFLVGSETTAAVQFSPFLNEVCTHSLSLMDSIALDRCVHGLARLPLFPPNITMVIMAKQFYFCYIRPEDISPKSTTFDPCAVANCSLAFSWQFWSSGFFLAKQPFRLCRYRTRFTVDIDTFVPVSSSIFTRSFAVVLGLICTFRTKVCPSLGDRMHLLPERYDGCVVPLYLYLRTIVCTNERGTLRCLKIASKVEPDLWRSWLIYFDFPMMSSKKHWVWRYALKYIHRYTSNWLKLCQLAFLKTWHHFLERSKLFKGTVKLVYVNFDPLELWYSEIISEIICL